MEKDPYTLDYKENRSPADMPLLLKIANVVVFVCTSLSLICGLTIWNGLNGRNVVLGIIACALLLMSDIAWLYTPKILRIEFHDDHLALCREKRQYSGIFYTEYKECIEIFYDKVTDCYYMEHTDELRITGKVHVAEYSYRADGNIKDKPDRDYIMSSGSVCINTNMDTRDIVQEIENHSPLKIRRKHAKEKESFKGNTDKME